MRWKCRTSRRAAAGAWGSGGSSRGAVAHVLAAAAVPPELRWGFAQTLSCDLPQPGWRRRQWLRQARPRNCPTLADAGLRLPAAAPALSACAPSRTGEGRVPAARGRSWPGAAHGPGSAALPTRWPGRGPRALDTPTPLPRVEAGDGVPSRDLRNTHSRMYKAGPFRGSLALQSLPQYLRL